jgi:hypothetical protein
MRERKEAKFISPRMMNVFCLNYRSIHGAKALLMLMRCIVQKQNSLSLAALYLRWLFFFAQNEQKMNDDNFLIHHAIHPGMASSNNTAAVERR